MFEAFVSLPSEAILGVLIASHVIFLCFMATYIILNLQWYNYDISRVLFKHHKVHWHILLFILPFLGYVGLSDWFWWFFYGVYIPFFVNWYKRLDKGLVLTPRVKRFFGFVLIGAFGGHALLYVAGREDFFSVSFVALVVAVMAMNGYEKVLFRSFYAQARHRLDSAPNLIVIQITASYGKTSIKNFLSAILQKHFRVYATPGNVNTLSGIVKDINTLLPQDAQIYIVESGARMPHDIKDIADLVKPQYVVLGTIGDQHIEYFKHSSVIWQTKMQILTSSRLQKAYVAHTNQDGKYFKDFLPSDIQDKLHFYAQDLEIRHSNLNGVEFTKMMGDQREVFKTKLLGRLNPQNLCVALDVAFDLGVEVSFLRMSVEALEFVPHRLQRLDSFGKVILDDSYNSNEQGMSEAIELVRQHEGKKIMVTCGLVESTKEANIRMAHLIDEVFDVVIVTGELNRQIYQDNVKHTQFLSVSDKRFVDKVLQSVSGQGDLILFANDAPSYI